MAEVFLIFLLIAAVVTFLLSGFNSDEKQRRTWSALSLWLAFMAVALAIILLIKDAL